MTYKIVSGSTHGLNDTQAFVESLQSLVTRVPYPDFLSSHQQLIVTRAPGRLDVMGGIADYSGSLVLQMPIAIAAHVALQKNNSNKVRLASIDSIGTNDTRQVRVFEMSLDEFLTSGRPIEYSTARKRFDSHSPDHWASYVAGGILVLMREAKVVFSEGFDIIISSAVPEGKGVSSSAALEVSSMNAIIAMLEIDISPVDIALFCQKVENFVAGAASGVMDQMTSESGEAYRLLELRCQPCDFLGTLAIPDDLKFWGLDSGIKHTVGGSAYTTARAAAFMGYRMIAELAGLPTHIDENGKAQIADKEWGGYLANIQPAQFENEFAPRIPKSITGEEFLARFGGTTDSVTTVKPEVNYPVLDATQHPIYENDRVQSFARSLRGEHDPKILGDLMFGSHQSYSRCGLGAKETDLIADLVRNSLEQGLYGARITGGGCGGTVVILGQRGAISSIERLAQEYENQTGNVATIISGSSPGAHSFQHLKLSVR